MTVFGIVFAVLGADRSAPEILEVMRASGPASTGLTFIWMPQLFSQMPFGGVLAVLFFLALTFAALSSLISMIELATRAFVDAGVGRGKAVAGVAAGAFVVGVPSALSGDFFGNQDFVWGVALMISGLFVAIAVTRYGAARLRAETATPTDWTLPAAWDLWLRFAIPVQAVVLLGWWLYRATTADFAAQWWNPLEPYSAASCLVQWGVVLGIAFAFNRTLARSGGAEPLGDAE